MMSDLGLAACPAYLPLPEVGGTARVGEALSTVSIEKVLMSIGEEPANRLAAAWHDHEREQQRHLNGLVVEIEKGTGRATLSVMLAGLTLAAFLAGSLYVGMELGALKQSVVTLQGNSKELQDGMKRLEDRFAATESLIKGIDDRTKRIESKQQASLDATGQTAPLLSESGQPGLYAVHFFQIYAIKIG